VIAKDMRNASVNRETNRNNITRALFARRTTDNGIGHGTAKKRSPEFVSEPMSVAMSSLIKVTKLFTLVRVLVEISFVGSSYARRGSKPLQSQTIRKHGE
jgi:hypothetical protein